MQISNQVLGTDPPIFANRENAASAKNVVNTDTTTRSHVTYLLGAP